LLECLVKCIESNTYKGQEALYILYRTIDKSDFEKIASVKSSKEV